MDPISNVDRIAILLRQRLLERAKATGSARSERKSSVQPAEPTPLERAEALATVEGVDDRQLRRALLQGILTDQLGADLINEARFQQVVDRVAETMEADPGAARLLDRIVKDLRAVSR